MASERSLARRYLSKIDSSRTRDILFELSFNEYKRLVSRKTCYYTGLRFNSSNPNLRLTVERIDSTKGYTKENSVACCLAANNIKSLWEQPGVPIDNKLMLKMLLKLNEVSKK